MQDIDPDEYSGLIYRGNLTILQRRSAEYLHARREAGIEALRVEVERQLTTTPPRQPLWKRLLYGRLWK
jgi:hypothetical protein